MHVCRENHNILEMGLGYLGRREWLESSGILGWETWVQLGFSCQDAGTRYRSLPDTWVSYDSTLPTNMQVDLNDFIPTFHPWQHSMCDLDVVKLLIGPLYHVRVNWLQHTCRPPHHRSVPCESLVMTHTSTRLIAQLRIVDQLLLFSDWP